MDESTLKKEKRKNKTRKCVATKKEKKMQSSLNCSMCQFPPEIWALILHHLHGIKDLKNLSRVCQLFNSIIKYELWKAPKFKSGMSPEDFIKLKHLPIKTICTRDFGILTSENISDSTGRWIEVISQFTQLTSLKLGFNINLTYSDSHKLSELTNLRSLTFEKLYWGMEASKAISQLVHLPLENLCIGHLVYDRDVEHISKSVSQISTLKKLKIQTNDKGCVYLSQLSKLEELVVNNSYLSTIVIMELGKLKSLKKVEFSQCWYSGDGMNRDIELLKAVNPNLLIDVIPIVTDASDDCPDYSDYEYGSDHYDHDDNYWYENYDNDKR